MDHISYILFPFYSPQLRKMDCAFLGLLYLSQKTHYNFCMLPCNARVKLEKDGKIFVLHICVTFEKTTTRIVLLANGKNFIFSLRCKCNIQIAKICRYCRYKNEDLIITTSVFAKLWCYT